MSEGMPDRDDNNNNNSNDKSKWLRDYGDLIYLGLMFPSAIAVGTVMGYFADRWLHTKPFGLLLGFLLGVIAAFYNLFQDYQKLQGSDGKKRKKDEPRKD